MSPKNTFDLVGFLFLEMTRALYLHGSKVTFHLSAQLVILSMSLFRLAVTHLLSLRDLISWNRAESFAYRYIMFSHSSPRSSINTENRSGPRIEPCGTEAFVDVVLDDWSDKTTLMLRCQCNGDISSQNTSYCRCRHLR